MNAEPQRGAFQLGFTEGFHLGKRAQRHPHSEWDLDIHQQVEHADRFFDALLKRQEETGLDARHEMLGELYEAVHGRFPPAMDRHPKDVWEELLATVREAS